MNTSIKLRSDKCMIFYLCIEYKIVIILNILNSIIKNDLSTRQLCDLA